jgi:hypothetical protein
VVDKIRQQAKGFGLNVETGDYEGLVKAGRAGMPGGMPDVM